MLNSDKSVSNQGVFQEGHCIMFKGSTLQKTNNDKYACSQQKRIKIQDGKWAQLKGEMNKSAITVLALNYFPSAIDKYRKVKISKDIVHLNSPIILFNLIDIHRVMYPKTTNNHFFQLTWNIHPSRPHCGP